MKKILFVLSAVVLSTFVPVLCRAQMYTLTVHIKDAGVARAYLVYEYGMTDQRVLDSAVSHHGLFRFSGEAVDPPVMAMLVIDHGGQGWKGADRRVVYLTPDKIVFTGRDSLATAIVKGSKVNSEYAAYEVMVGSVIAGMERVINARYAAASEIRRKDSSFMSGLMEDMKSIWRLRDSLTIRYIQAYPDSYIALVKLKEVAGKDIDVSRIGPLYNALSVRLRSTSTGVAFGEAIEAARYTSIGSMAPDFTQNDVNDRPVRLSDFRGKYILLDFWASWCGPCRAENPNVVKAYNKYKEKNFTVLSVSLDGPGVGKKTAWLAAIKADGLTWTQVSDLKAWNNSAAREYAIKAIPQNFLIDPTGKIVGKNLRGDELEKKLEEIL